MENVNPVKRQNSLGVPKLLPPLHPSLANHPRYQLRDLVSSDKGEDKERVRVEHYVHDKSFKERLKFYFVTDQRYSIRWQIFRFVLKIVSCALYIVRASQDTEPHKAAGFGCENRPDSDWACPAFDNDTDYYGWSLLWVHRPFPLWIVQTVIAVYSMLDAILLCYLTYKGGSVLNKIMKTRLIPEILLGLPFLVSIFYDRLRNLWLPLFLNCWIARSALDTMLNDLHRLVLRQQSALSQKVLIVFATVMCILFTGVCGIHHLERPVQKPWHFFECIWFIVVTFSTVGYGDFRPDDELGRLFVIIMIGCALILLPIELEQLAFHLVTRQKEGGRFNRMLAGSEKHVVLCATTPRATMLIDFLNEFYADVRLQDHHVVLLCPSELDSALRILLQVPVWSQRVTYLKGSALIDEDLIRARVEDAVGCFILTDRYADDREAADKHTILRTWAIQDFAPTTHLYVQILKPENKFHVSFAEYVVCEDELKHALLASNCVCPGISTFFTLLLHTLHEQRGSEDWHEMYGKCAGNEIYDIRLGESKMFRPFCNKTFTHTAFHVHRKYGVTLIAVQAAKKGRRILLNPGPLHVMDYDDQCFYISISSEEDSHIKAYKEPKESIRLFKGSFRGNKDSFITASSIALELRAENAESIQLDEVPANGVQYADCSDQVNSSPLLRPGSVEKRGRTKEVAFDVGDSRRSSNSVCPAYESDSEDQQETDLLDDISRIPRYQNTSYVAGVPPCSLYIGQTPIRCHLLTTPKKCCCLGLRDEECQDRNRDDSVQLHQRQNSAIIVASPVAGAGLYNFILPLRAYQRPKCTLKPIVLLLKEKPNPDFLLAVCHFPMLYYMIGTINSLDDLIKAGCLHADSIVVVGYRSHGQIYDEDHMADANTIVDVQSIYRCFPRATLIVELTHASNMRFMKFNADISLPPEMRSESMSSVKSRSLRESVKKRIKQQNKDHLNYMFREPFAAGHVFSMSMLDTLLYQAFVKKYMIRLIRLLLGCEQAPGSGYLSSLKITEGSIWLATYGRLFQKLCSTTCAVPIGLYRTRLPEEDLVDAFPKRKKKEVRDISDIIEIRMKTLNIIGTPDMRQRPGKSYVIVNPPPEFELKLEDVIYLIRPCNAQTDLEDEEDPPPLEPLNSGMFANSSEDFPSTAAI
ncbi:potassium channel subfamily T member 2-like isoform X3 [Montipora capricornis]|uniref:potassium channel subfamily T member 2-like isoform X3 n=1 Tax=Montipora capricornis TaxID=246305 RepID=UPI0035F162E5